MEVLQHVPNSFNKFDDEASVVNANSSLDPASSTRHVRTWNLPAFVMYLTPLKGLYVSPYMSRRLTLSPLTANWLILKRTVSDGDAASDADAPSDAAEAAAGDAPPSEPPADGAERAEI